MATGRAVPSGAFAGCHVVQTSVSPTEMYGQERSAATTESSKWCCDGRGELTRLEVLEFLALILGKVFMGWILASSPQSSSFPVSFTLSAPALVVIMGVGSSQATLNFSGLDNPTIDVLNQTIDGVNEPVLSCLNMTVSRAGTYTKVTTGDGTAFYKPSQQGNLLGVYIFSTSPNAASSSNPQIPLPAFQPTSSTSLRSHTLNIADSNRHLQRHKCSRSLWTTSRR